MNVNNVTKGIYPKYNKPTHFVKLGRRKIERLIKRIGIFRVKAKSIFYLSKTYAAMGSSSSAKKYALEVNKYRSGWGAPFMLIGDLYAQTSRSCGENTGNLTNDEFTKRVGYWAAIEKYEYAKKIDYSLLKEANQKIKKYIEQAPDKTSTFQIIGLDQKEYKI